jgi:hypothetical protein
MLLFGGDSARVMASDPSLPLGYVPVAGVAGHQRNGDRPTVIDLLPMLYPYSTFWPSECQGPTLLPVTFMVVWPRHKLGTVPLAPQHISSTEPEQD